MKKAPPPLMRESMADRVRQSLLERILSGELAPGTRLTELHIAAEMQTSQGPVREALRELEATGMVHTEPYKGSRVREVTPQEMREAYLVRGALEHLAATLAAPVLKGSTAPLAELAECVRRAARRKDLPEYVRCDMAFHRTIVEASGNKILLRSWESLGLEIRSHVRLTRSSLNLVDVQGEHLPIVEALGRGAGNTAGRLLREHIVRFVS